MFKFVVARFPAKDPRKHRSISFADVNMAYSLFLCKVLLCYTLSLRYYCTLLKGQYL